MSFDDDSLPPLARIAKKAGNMVAEKREDIIANRRWRFKDNDPESPVTPADIMNSANRAHYRAGTMTAVLTGGRRFFH